MPEIAWIAADWGTTHLRVWAMDAGNAVVASNSSADGMGKVSAGAFETALLSVIGDWLVDSRVTPVIACGMVGARQGWIEAPYRSVPAALPSPDALTQAPTADPRMAVFIISGLMQTSPPDVMRGEETQIAGVLAERPDFEGVIGMPGTHTKWTTIAAGRVTEFASRMTGEMFALLSKHSILGHSICAEQFNISAFDRTAREIIDSGDYSLSRLFSIRADDLIHVILPQSSRAKLSAMLIASEIGALLPRLRGTKIMLVGDVTLVDLYARTLHAAGLEADVVDGSAMTLNGIVAAKTAWEATV